MQASPVRCERCRFPVPCLCPEIPSVAAPFELVVLRHVSDRPKLSNTGLWAALSVRGARLVDHGDPGPATDLAALDAPGVALLFPSPSAALPPWPAPPRVLVVPDGTWTQARRMVQRLPALRTMPRLALPAPPPGLRMRRPLVAGGMSTIEAVAGALAAAGEADGARRLLALHESGVERVLRLKGTYEAERRGTSAHAGQQGPEAA
ncbi:MAG: DTW domain-containing protein [Anaeromyxobacteraceae bacterium]